MNDDPQEKTMPKFILLRNPRTLDRFFTTHNPESDQTVCQGVPTYEVLGYAETVEDAQVKLYGRSALLPTI
jgi:hypothetical protein